MTQSENGAQQSATPNPARPASVFRQEAVDQFSVKRYGSVLLVRPVSNSLLILFFLAIALAMGLAWAIVRSITRPLGQAVLFADRVADGGLSGQAVVAPKDETGQLLMALERMQGSLVAAVGTVRSSADGVASASAQIAAGNHDLSARTEEQASALEQTAASMEELASTVRLNADNAREANQRAEGRTQHRRHASANPRARTALGDRLSSGSPAGDRLHRLAPTGTCAPPTGAPRRSRTPRRWPWRHFWGIFDGHVDQGFPSEENRL